MMEGKDPFSGLMNFLVMIDWNSITRAPANRNLVPANRIMEGVSEVDISKIPYPILIAGVALPHKKQQSIANRKTIGRDVSLSLFSITFPFGYSFVPL